MNVRTLYNAVVAARENISFVHFRVVRGEVRLVDVNKYFENSENSVEYLSRDNWAESFPAGGVKLKMTEKLAGALMAQDVRRKLVRLCVTDKL